MRISDFRHRAFNVCALIGAAAIAACGGGSSNMPGTTGMTGTSGQLAFSQLHHSMPDWLAQHQAHAACPQVIGQPTCLALIQDKDVKPACMGETCGWGPIDFQTRYNLPSGTNGLGQIVAIVDAYDEPNASSDLSTYRTQFGLGSANFTKYNQTGQTKDYPQSCVSGGWCVAEDLDIEMVSAACPNCTIYLVEANTSASTDLESAEAEAVKLGAHIVSNSWLCFGSISCVGKKYFDTAGVEYVAASGDSGSNQVGFPAAFDSVSAIGGTQLAKSGSKYSETIWSDGGGGCATGIKKPKWQSTVPGSVCEYRLTNDAAAEAGCSPGVAEYDSNEGGWFAVCGTGVSAPLLAGVFGLAGNATQQIGGHTFWKTKHHKHLYYINGQCSYRQGQYTTCDGWGSPNGIGAF